MEQGESQPTVIKKKLCNLIDADCYKNYPTQILLFSVNILDTFTMCGTGRKPTDIDLYCHIHVKNNVYDND